MKNKNKNKKENLKSKNCLIFVDGLFKQNGMTDANKVRGQLRRYFIWLFIIAIIFFIGALINFINCIPPIVSYIFIIGAICCLFIMIFIMCFRNSNKNFRKIEKDECKAINKYITKNKYKNMNAIMKSLEIYIQNSKDQHKTLNDVTIAILSAVGSALISVSFTMTSDCFCIFNNSRLICFLLGSGIIFFSIFIVWKNYYGYDKTLYNAEYVLDLYYEALSDGVITNEETRSNSETQRKLNNLSDDQKDLKQKIEKLIIDNNKLSKKIKNNYNSSTPN